MAEEAESLRGNLAKTTSGGKLKHLEQSHSFEPFAEGLAGVEIGSKWGYINRSGRLVIEPQFDYAQSFSEGLAGVEIGGKVGYIDRSGRLVIEPVRPQND